MFKRLKSVKAKVVLWLNKKFGAEKFITELKETEEVLQKEMSKVDALHDALVNARLRYQSEISSLYHLISGFLLREENNEIFLSKDLMAMALNTPDIKLLNVSENSIEGIKIKFEDPKFDLES